MALKMTEVIRVKTKGLYIELEFSYDELVLLRAAMNKCEVNVNLADKDQKAAHDYFTKDFYQLINTLVEDLKKDAT
jgi:hypothetical protein